MGRKLVGIKGLYTVTKQNVITEFLDHIKSITTLEFPYTKFLAYHTYCLDKIRNTIDELEEELNPNDSIIAHSFGCLLVYDLLAKYAKKGYGTRYKNIYMVSPAIDQDLFIPERNFEKMWVFYNPLDLALKVGSMLPFNRMGKMGKYGYRYRSKKIQNVEIPIQPSIIHHNDFFDGDNLKKYVKFVEEQENES